MTFSEVLELLKQGKRVRNRGWNGENMYIALQRPNKNSKMTMPYIYIKTPCGDLIPWLPSQYDLLSDGWEEVNTTP